MPEVEKYPTGFVGESRVTNDGIVYHRIIGGVLVPNLGHSATSCLGWWDCSLPMPGGQPSGLSRGQSRLVCERGSLSRDHLVVSTTSSPASRSMVTLASSGRGSRSALRLMSRSSTAAICAVER